MQAIQIETFGNPAEVLNVVDVPDVGTPGKGEVVIALEAGRSCRALSEPKASAMWSRLGPVSHI